MFDGEKLLDHVSGLKCPICGAYKEFTVHPDLHGLPQYIKGEPPILNSNVLHGVGIVTCRKCQGIQIFSQTNFQS